MTKKIPHYYNQHHWNIAAKKRAIFETDLEMAYAQLEYWQEEGVKHKIEKIEQDIEELENILEIEK